MNEEFSSFSVIIPAFNCADTIGKTLESILRQTVIAREIILVDDGSSDETPAIIRRYPVKLVQFEKNCGAGAARNRGADFASGDILVFVDADVALEPEAIEKLIQPIICGEAAAVSGNYSQNIESLNFPSAYKQLYIHWAYESAGRRLYNQFWTAIGAVKREVFLNAGKFREDFQGAGWEDIDLGVKLSQGGHTVFFEGRAQGKHLHRTTIIKLIINDLKKGSEDIFIHLTKKASLSSNRHSSPKHILSALSSVMVIASIPMSLFDQYFIAVLFAGLFFFYFMQKKFINLLMKFDWNFAVRGYFLSILLYFVRMMCVPLGVLRAGAFMWKNPPASFP